jgi:acetylornithine deacetylase/succinyl-diaminopimelate desuccinylase-like protein
MPNPTSAADSRSSERLADVARIAALAPVEAAAAWFLAHAEELLERQMEVTRILAPPFGEAARAEWLAARFGELGLDDVHIDGIGNVVGLRPGLHPPTDARYLAITAHIDTVFPVGTGVSVRREGNRLYGPGISDNSAGITALLALAGALRHAEIRTESPLVFIGNVGEEGEGDVRGMRYLFADPRWRDAIAATLVLDGAGTDTVVTEALGSKRFLVTILGPGGHSWSDFGTANPIVVLSRAIDQFARTPVPASPKTTFNIGVITGGTSVNSIPESASIKVDIRSAAGEQVERLERALRDAVERAVASEPRTNFGGRSHSGIVADIKLIGSRPAARLNAGSSMLAVVQAVDVHLDNNARLQRASTDANIPLSQGRDAIAIGAGGAGGGAHTLHEWYDPTGRDLGLRRILLTVLTVAGVQE